MSNTELIYKMDGRAASFNMKITYFVVNLKWSTIANADKMLECENHHSIHLHTNGMLIAIQVLIHQTCLPFDGAFMESVTFSEFDYKSKFDNIVCCLYYFQIKIMRYSQPTWVANSKFYESYGGDLLEELAFWPNKKFNKLIAEFG